MPTYEGLFLLNMLDFPFKKFRWFVDFHNFLEIKLHPLNLGIARKFKFKYDFKKGAPFLLNLQKACLFVIAHVTLHAQYIKCYI